jgi:hypothetical protein
MNEKKELSESEMNRYNRLKYIISRSRDVYVFCDFLQDYVKTDHSIAIKRLKRLQQRAVDCPHFSYPDYGDCYIS